MMISTVSNSAVPHLAADRRVPCGARHWHVRAPDPRLFAWPSAKSAVMGGAQLSGVLSIVAGGSREARGRQVGNRRRGVRARRRGRSKAESLPLVLSGIFTTSRVIDPRDTRTVLGMCLSCIANGRRWDVEPALFRM